MLPTAMLLSSVWPIIQLNYVAILTFYSPNLHTHEINEDDVDKNENEEMTKLWRHFVRYDCKCAYALVMSDYHSHRSRFNNKQFE